MYDSGEEKCDLSTQLRQLWIQRKGISTSAALLAGYCLAGD